MFRSTTHILKTAVFCFSTIAHTAQAVIIETPTLRTAMNYITEKNAKETAFIADIDNTLAWCDLGDQWFSHMWKQQMDAGMTDPNEIVAKILPVYIFAQECSNLEPTELHIPEFFEQLSSLGVTCMGLTARSLPLAERTCEQLHNISIDFQNYNPPLDTKEMDCPLSIPAKYKHGIVFCGNNNKGELLFHFFDLAGIDYPKIIIFADDKLKNVKAVEEAVEKRGIKFIGLRYSREDEKVKNFDSKNADAKLAKLYKKYVQQAPEELHKTMQENLAAAIA